MQYIYACQGGCGKTEIKLILNKNDKTFQINYYCYWIGDKQSTKILVTGKYNELLVNSYTRLIIHTIQDNEKEIFNATENDTLSFNMFIFGSPMKFTKYDIEFSDLGMLSSHISSYDIMIIVEKQFDFNQELKNIINRFDKLKMMVTYR